MLNLWHLSLPRPQIRLEHPPKHLQQHLKAHLCHRRVVSSLAQLVADKRVLRPRKLVKARHHAGLAHLGANQIPARVGDVRVLDAENHGHLALEAGKVVERVRAGGGRLGGGVGAAVGAEGAAVDVGGKVGDAGGDARVELQRLAFHMRDRMGGFLDVGCVQRRGRRDGRLDTCPWRR